MHHPARKHQEDEKIARLRCFYGILEPDSEHTELDLGCGAGSFTVALAKRYPERLVYAADMLMGRLRKVVKRSENAGCSNVRAMQVEARFLLSRLLPDNSLDRIHLLCPDPWPKDRHRGHRLLASDFTTQIHRVLKPGGIFHFSSDDANYCDAVGRVLEASQLFEPYQEGIADLEGVRSDFENHWREQGLEVPHRAWRRLPLPAPGIGH